MDGTEKREMQTGSLGVFTVLVLVIQVLGLTSVILVAVWMGSYRGGFAWQSNPSLEFNYHPVFMVTGMIFLFSDAILTYRVFRNVRKVYLKAIHGCIHVAVLIFAGVGLKAVWDSHTLNSIPNMYSLHSWLGLSTVVLFGLQWLCGMIAFVFPQLSMGARQMYMPHHTFWGLALLCMAAGSALTGLTEKVWLTDRYDSANFVYGQLPPEAYVVNFLGVSIVAMIILVGYVVTREEYKRQPSPDEEHIQLVG